MASPRASVATLDVPAVASSQSSNLEQKSHLDLAGKTTLELLLDKSPAAYDVFLQKMYETLKGNELGEFFHALVRTNQYDEIARLFVRRPDLSVNYSDSLGNTALHIAFSNITMDFSVVSLLCEKGGSLAAKNAKQLSPLQLSFTTEFETANVIQQLLLKWHESVPSVHLQEIFLETVRRKWYKLSLYLLETYTAKLQGNVVADVITGNRVIHQAVLATPMDVSFLAILIQQGASLRDTNKAGQTPLDLLLNEKAYDKIISLADNFPEALTIAQSAKIFAQLIAEQQYDIYAQLLVLHAKNRADKNFLIESLANAVRHLPIETVTSVVRLLLKEQPNDISFLKYLDLARDATMKEKKSIVDEMVRAALRQMYSPQDMVDFIVRLEAETREMDYPNLGFFRERKAASFYGHTWRGQPACGTWIRLMEDTQRRIVELYKGLGQQGADPVVEAFLGERTRERHFSLFTQHPERRFLDRYLKSQEDRLKASAPPPQNQPVPPAMML